MSNVIHIDFKNGASIPEEPAGQSDIPLSVAQTASRLLELRVLLCTDINTANPEATRHRLATLAWELEHLRLGGTLPEQEEPQTAGRERDGYDDF